MKKLLSIIIALATLFLVSCASDDPTESIEPWITSIISTTASVQVGTTATTQTDATVPTTSTPAASSTQGDTAPQTPQIQFIKSGYPYYANYVVETSSKVILMNYLGGNGGMNDIKAIYYYSKADGEFYPFCFNPLCDHNNYDPQTQTYTPKCIGSILRDPFFARADSSNLVYLDSRLFFPYMGGLYSCSEFATDMKEEVILEKYNSFDDYRDGRGGVNPVIYSLTSDEDSLFFCHITPKGKQEWLKYTPSSKKITNISDLADSAGKTAGKEYSIYKISDGRVYMIGYVWNNDGTSKTAAGNYVADIEFKSIKNLDDEPYKSYIFKTNDGYVCRDKIGSESVAEKHSLVYRKLSGETFTIIEDSSKTLGNWIGYLYMTDKYIYFTKGAGDLIGYSYFSYAGRYDELIGNTDGRVYRYDLNTGNVDVFLDEKYIDVLYIEYINEDENVAVIVAQSYEKTGEKHNGYDVFELFQPLFKCRLDENGIVDDYEIVDFSEI